MKKIQLTQGQYSLVDDEDYEYLSQWNWYARKDRKGFYAQRQGTDNKRRFQIHMHRVILNLKPTDSVEVDHINGNSLDNRKENLRACSHKDNSRNRRKYSTNTSGYTGVSWHKHTQKWAAKIGVNGKWIHLGIYSNPEDAHNAYQIAAKQYFGEFYSND